MKVSININLYIKPENLTFGDALRLALEKLRNEDDFLDNIEHCSSPENISSVDELDSRNFLLTDNSSSPYGSTEWEKIRKLHAEGIIAHSGVICCRFNKLEVDRWLGSGIEFLAGRRTSVRSMVSGIKALVEHGEHYRSSDIYDFFKEEISREDIIQKFQDFSFSTKEKAIFELIGAGKNVREIASILKLSPVTIYRVRNDVAVRLGVRSTAIALAMLVKYDYLSLDE